VSDLKDSNNPTLLTTPGTVMGTVGYMDNWIAKER
jgi:hypothetical protein